MESLNIQNVYFKLQEASSVVSDADVRMDIKIILSPG